jgi:hypothetical protein
MAAVLTAALGVAAIVLGITAVASHLYSWLLRAEGSERRHLHGANSDQFAIYKFSPHSTTWRDELTPTSGEVSSPRTAPDTPVGTHSGPRRACGFK